MGVSLVDSVFRKFAMVSCAGDLGMLPTSSIGLIGILSQEYFVWRNKKNVHREEIYLM